MNQLQYQLMETISKIKIFKGLDLPHIQRILRAAAPKEFEQGQMVYQVNKPSLDMLVLLKGKLLATAASGETLGEILPGTAAGEMGVMTGQPRTANITAVEKSMALVIKKEALFLLLAADHPMQICCLRNMVDILSDRLVRANKQNSELVAQIAELKNKVKG